MPAPSMNFDPSNPFIVQSDRSVLVEVDNPKYAEARDAIAPFAELEKSPEHIHTYRISNLSLWNAAAAGFTEQGGLYCVTPRRLILMKGLEPHRNIVEFEG